MTCLKKFRHFMLASLMLGALLGIGGENIMGEDNGNAVVKYQLHGSELKDNVQLTRGKLLSTNDAVEAYIAPDAQGAFYQINLNWDTTTIKQIEFSLMAKSPGYFQFACGTTSENKYCTFSVSPQAAIPDGEYHHYIFKVSEDVNWRGTMNNWELKWVGEPGVIGMNKLSANGIVNHIADAAELKPGKETVVVKQLKPRAKCRLSWSGTTSPGVTLRFYDQDLKELKDTAVTLGKGKEAIEFTTPEMLIETRVTLDKAGEGFPVLEQLAYVSPSDSVKGNISWRGKWLWSQNAPGPIDRSIWFERVIELDDKPEFAVMANVGDDCSYVYVNGKFIGKTERWAEVGRYDITDYLKAGINRISCRVRNIDSWGGFLADVYIKLKDREIFADTNEEWRCDTKSNTDTTIPTCTETSVVLGAYDVAPWYGAMQFRYTGRQGSFVPVKLEQGRMTVRVESLPAMSVGSLRFVTKNESGSKNAFMLAVTPNSDNWKVGAEITISYPIPYVDKGKCSLFLEDDLMAIKGNPMLAVIEKAPSKAPELRRASFVGGGRPMLKMDDELIMPVFWHAPNAYGQSRIAGLSNFADNNMRSYRICAYFQDFWKPDGTFDFTVFDKEVATLLTIVPDAVFAVHVYSFMPEWWLARNPDDLSRHENGNPRDLWLDKQSLGSQKWLTEGEIPLKALIEHIKVSGYADRVWGMSFTENNCGEWFWTSADATGKISYAGYSPADYASFRLYLKEKYETDAALAKAWAMPNVKIVSAPMPDLERARKGSVGALLDASQDMQMVDFFEFRSLALAKAIIHFGKFTKEQTDGKWLIGAYYGYFAEMIANSRRNIQSNGHNGFLETARSPYVDFVHAPLRYSVRKTGQPGTMMQLWDTFLLHGKMVYVEQDVRTSYAPREEAKDSKIYCGTPDTALCDIGQFYRSFGMTTATGTLNYWYDLVLNQFDEKALNKVITDLNNVYMSLGPVRGTTPFEVAVVSDRDSIYYSQYPDANTPNTIASEEIFKHFNELAVPFKSLTVSDLLDKSITVKPFKCYVMLPTLMLSQEQRRQLMTRFEQEKATVIWLYAAGAFYPNHGPSSENCGDFLGLKTKMVVENACPEMTTTLEFGGLHCVNFHASSPWFYPVSGFDTVIGKNGDGQPLMVAKKIGNSMHYYTVLTNLPLQLYAKIMEKAEVHRYSDSVGIDQFWIGNDVLFIHAVTNGEKSFVLPDGYRAKAIVGPFKSTLKNGEKFTARAGMTYGFLIEK